MDYRVVTVFSMLAACMVSAIPAQGAVSSASDKQASASVDQPSSLPSTGLVLWNRLGSSNEVQNSEIGPNGTLNAGRFVEGTFGQGIELNMQEQMGVTFPPHVVPATNGCIEFWAKLSGFPDAIRQPGGAWPGLVGTSVTSVQVFGIAFCVNNGAGSGGLVHTVPGLGSSGTGVFGSWTYASAIKTNTVSDWHHYALVWASAGIPGVDNCQRQVVSYVDGNLNTSHWIGSAGTPFTGLTNGTFGLLAHHGVETGSVAYDNIKIWNFAKTDFSDRFNEDITPPASLTVSFDSQGGSSVDSRVFSANTLYGVLPIPTRDRFTFAGWFKDAAYTLPVSADIAVGTENHVLYAKWTVAPTPGSGLVLWNRLGSTNEVLTSEIGPNGTLNAGLFVDAPFGKGIELNMQQQMGVTFPPHVVPATNGCIEFWAKLSGFPDAIRQPGGAWPELVGTLELNFGIAFCCNNGVASGGLVQGAPGLGTSGTGLYGYWTYASAIKTNNVNDWHHYALVWSGEGIPGVDNGQRRVISYVDGRMNTGHWIGTTGTHFTGLTNVTFGLLAHQGVPSGTVAYDNIKIWNFAKTNFSDRFDEAAGDLRRKLTVAEARGEAIPPNGIQTYLYGDGINASVPSIVTDGGVRYVCTGAAVAGNAFTLSGTTNVTLALTNNATLTWQWQTQYRLELSTNGNGGVTAAAGWYADGGSVQLTATPATGWAFAGWEGETDGCVMEGPVITVTMSQARNLSARFALATALLTLNPQGGSVSPGTKTVTYDCAYGELPMPERPDYRFTGWWTGLNGQGTQVTASTVVSVAGDHTLYASWAKIPLLCQPEEDALLSAPGVYEGFLYDETAFDGDPTSEVRGTLTLSVFSREDSATAKVRVQDGVLSFRKQAWSAAGHEGFRQVVMTAMGGEVLDLSVGQNVVWGTLLGGSLGNEILAVYALRNRFVDRQDAGAQAILNTFRGYYTVALPAYGALSLGAAQIAPEGVGYLTLSVGDQGRVSIGGVLADGTRLSKSGSLMLVDGCGPEACMPLFVPLYSQKGWVSGLLWFDPVQRTVVTDRDLGWFLRWEKPGSGKDGFSELLDACGGFYSSAEALAAHYRFSAGTNAVPYFYLGGSTLVQSVFPSEINVAVDGLRLTMAKGVAPVRGNSGYDYTASENNSMATLTFQAATGIFDGHFKLYYDYVQVERQQHKTVTVPYTGVLIPKRSEPFADLPAGLGFYLVPDNNPAWAPLRLRRSYPIELDANKK